MCGGGDVCWRRRGGGGGIGRWDVVFERVSETVRK